MTEMTMRAPCTRCGGTAGRIDTRNGQDCVYCLGCGSWCYNAPKTETGRAVRSLSTRPDLKPKQRARILDRDGARCVICGAKERIDIGHILSVDDGKALGWSNAELYDDENLAVMCGLCNAGYGALSISPRLAAALIQARVQRRRESA